MAEKLSQAEMFRNIAHAINVDKLSVFLPPFGARYYTIEGARGLRFYLREGDQPGVLEYVHEHCLANEIIEWINQHVINKFNGYNIDFRTAIEASRVWRAMTPPQRDIKVVSWADDPSLTFHKLPWSQMPGATPTFDRLFSRISNAKPLKAFIGSLLVEESYRQQYVWIYGKGGDGKGALNRFMHKVFGNAYSSQKPPTWGDKFWTSGLLGKRLVAFPDCEDQAFVTTGLFMQLTGGDPVRVEQKQQTSYTAVLNAKYMFLSNDHPNISSKAADLRRIIYCEILPLARNDYDTRFEEKLWAEGGAFLTECLQTYHEMCPHHEAIKIENDARLGDLVSSNEEEFETAFENNFRLDKQAYVLPAAFQDRLQEIWPREKRQRDQFKKWLESKHNIRKMTDHGLTGDPKVYSGMAMIFAGQVVKVNQQKQQEIQDGSGTRLGQIVGQAELIERQGWDIWDESFT